MGASSTALKGSGSRGVTGTAAKGSMDGAGEPSTAATGGIALCEPEIAPQKFPRHLPTEAEAACSSGVSPRTTTVSRDHARFEYRHHFDALLHLHHDGWCESHRIEPIHGTNA